MKLTKEQKRQTLTALFVFAAALMISLPGYSKKAHVLTSDDFNSLIKEGIQAQNQIAPPVDTRNELHRGPNYKTQEFRRMIIEMNGNPGPVISRSSRSTANESAAQMEALAARELQKKRLQRTSMEIRGLDSL